MKNLLPFAAVLLVLAQSTLPANADEVSPLPRTGPTILFLGDSITAAGHYVNDIETYLLLNLEDELPTIVALGLGSETCCGLTEPDHPFPRPTVQERLDRVLERVQPDHVVACYGMNDGIYHPFSEARFAAYQQGIHTIIRKAHAIGAKVTLLTPPPYAGSVIPQPEPQDGQPYGYKTPYARYDDVLAKYAEFILSLKDDRVDAIDVRTPMLAHLAKEYNGSDPVHPNGVGHEIMAEAILAHWGHETTNRIIETGLSSHAEDERWQQTRKLVAQRRRTYDNTLLWDIGHKRPGNRPKITLDEAASHAQDLDAEIAARLGLLQPVP